MACNTCGATVKPIVGYKIQDVGNLPPYQMVNKNNFYRLPDGSLWIVNNKCDGWQRVDSDTSVINFDDTDTIDLNLDPTTNTVTAKIKDGVLPTFSVDGSAPVLLKSIEVIND